MRFYNSIYESGVVPDGWRPLRRHTIKERITQQGLLAELRRELPGRWRKVYRRGVGGVDIHCFEHESGKVFNVKIKITEEE